MPFMNDHRSKRDTMSLEEAAISDMWEIAALVELLEQKDRINERSKQIAHKTTH